MQLLISELARRRGSGERKRRFMQVDRGPPVLEPFCGNRGPESTPTENAYFGCCKLRVPGSRSASNCNFVALVTGVEFSSEVR